MPLAFDFTYNAQAAAENGPLGFGWTHAYNMRLEVDGSEAIVHQENGAQVPFSLDGSQWISPSRFDAELAPDGPSWTFTRRGVERFTFDSSGRLTSMRRLTDPTTYLTSVTYPSAGTTVVTDVAGRTLTLSSSGDRIVSVTDSASPARSLAFDYNAAGELVEYSDASGGSWGFEYESSGSHRMSTMRKPTGEGLANPPLLTNVYDDAGRVVEQTDWEGRTTTLEYTTLPDANVTSTLVTDPRGHKTMKVFAYGVLTGKIEGYGTADESSWGYELDPATLGVTRVIDPAGRSSTTTYDERGRALTVTDPTGVERSWTYDEFNNVLTETAPNPSATGPDDVTTTYTYDDGHLVSELRPLYTTETAATELETVYSRDDPAHPDDVTSITDADGATTSFDYDPGTGDLLSVSDPEGNTTSYTYDGVGRRLTIVAPNGNAAGANPADWTTSFEYDPNGRVTEVVEPIDATTTATTSSTYDADGNLETVTDANGNVTTNQYDAAGQLVQVHRPDGSVLVNEYWPDGQLKAQVDGSGTAAMSYDHDAQGRVTSTSDALGNLTTFGYDAAGNLGWKADPGGSCPPAGGGTGCTRYDYDEAGKLVEITYSDGTTPSVTYEYSAAGQRTTMADGTGTSSYAYDSLGRLTNHTNGAGATVAYDYDLAGRLTGVDYPGFGPVTYDWDDAGRVETVNDWDDRTFTYGHDANGNVTSIEFPDASANLDGFVYDRANRMTAHVITDNGAWLAGGVYGRDPIGQVTAASPFGALTGSQTYGYTELDQLCYAAPAGTGTCTTPPTGAGSYAYDSADNLTATPAAATQRFNAANQLCWITQVAATESCETAPAGATTFDYDTRGNRTATTPAGGAATTYSYDQANRLVETSGAVTSSYAYNGDGLRTQSTIAGETSEFTWNQAGDLPLALTDGHRAYVYGPDGLPLAHEDVGTGDVAYYHHDQLGSTRLLTGADGATIGTVSYDPYGNVGSSSGETSPLGFAGQYTDPQTGLQYLRARYYDPSTGQFLNRDPAVDATRQPFAYATNNPLNFVDPSGLCSFLGQRIPLMSNENEGCKGSGVIKDYADDVSMVSGLVALSCTPFVWTGVGAVCVTAAGTVSLASTTIHTFVECGDDGWFQAECGWSALQTTISWGTFGMGAALGHWAKGQGRILGVVGGFFGRVAEALGYMWNQIITNDRNGWNEARC